MNVSVNGMTLYGEEEEISLKSNERQFKRSRTLKKKNKQKHMITLIVTEELLRAGLNLTDF